MEAAAQYPRKYQPVLFETLVFGDKHDILMYRCHTWGQTVQVHRLVAKLVVDSVSRTQSPDAFQSGGDGHGGQTQWNAGQG